MMAQNYVKSEAVACIIVVSISLILELLPLCLVSGRAYRVLLIIIALHTALHTKQDCRSRNALQKLGMVERDTGASLSAVRKGNGREKKIS